MKLGTAILGDRRRLAQSGIAALGMWNGDDNDLVRRHVWPIAPLTGQDSRPLCAQREPSREQRKQTVERQEVDEKLAGATSAGKFVWRKAAHADIGGEQGAG